MNKKNENWFVLCISLLAIIGIGWVVYKNLNFFLTKKEAEAKIISINQPSDFIITVSYYNEYDKKKITCSVKIKSSYKNKVEQLGQTVNIYYAKEFPNSIYIGEINTPTIAMTIFIFLVIIFICFALVAAIKNIKINRNSINNR